MTDAEDNPRPSLLPLLGLVLFGFGPGIVFLLGYLFAPGPEAGKIFIATAVFMIASVAFRLLAGRPKPSFWPFPWTVPLIVLMGGLTLWLQDETFIKMRPTLHYAGGAVLMAVQLGAFRPRLDALWRVDTMNFDRAGQSRMGLLAIGFAVAMAALNELVWRQSSDLFWIGFQIWGPVAGFALIFPASIPTLRRHLTAWRKVPATD